MRTGKGKRAMKLTGLEMKVLKALAFNHYGEGGETWSWATNESTYPSGVTGKSLSGVLASLAKKGLVKPNGEGREGSIRTLEAGAVEMCRHWPELKEVFAAIRPGFKLEG